MLNEAERKNKTNFFIEVVFGCAGCFIDRRLKANIGEWEYHSK